MDFFLADLFISSYSHVQRTSAAQVKTTICGVPFHYIEFSANYKVLATRRVAPLCIRTNWITRRFTGEYQLCTLNRKAKKKRSFESDNDWVQVFSLLPVPASKGHKPDIPFE